MDDFDTFCVNMDSDCLHQDFDDYDLYGERTIENEYDGFGDDIQFN